MINFLTYVRTQLIVLLTRTGHTVKETDEKWYFLEVDLCLRTFNIQRFGNLLTIPVFSHHQILRYSFPQLRNALIMYNLRNALIIAKIIQYYLFIQYLVVFRIISFISFWFIIILKWTGQLRFISEERETQKDGELQEMLYYSGIFF